MRLRKVKHAGETIRNNPKYVIAYPESKKGLWNKTFGNNNPISLEIGCGKGLFLMEMARKNPDVSFIGIEKFDSVLVRALEKLIIDPLPNLLFVLADAADVDLFFDSDEIKHIYINFPDPWPKTRKAKYRLTNEAFLPKYRQILSENGKVYLRTDNFPMFEYSMMSINRSDDFSITDIALGKGIESDGYVETEFEIKYRKMGLPIFYLEASVERSRK
ncbi:MAG TPA: tRNA (guanosine(46)-N7)-methyltransferase TrmB [Candidatus Izemoplasmatales bacterium]|nr:tRNA (guanosine(46)-N7)-methyltransferase TrmB [Candidatus Izemoplasmatales bacterium]